MAEINYLTIEEAKAIHQANLVLTWSICSKIKKNHDTVNCWSKFPYRFEYQGYFAMGN